MGSDMKLTGLASGFDWQPIVDQLIDLERTSVRRLEQEKKENNDKVSILGTLKSQLDTLKGAANALSEESLFNARKVTVNQNLSSAFSASAESGALTGDFSVKVHSKATKTEMSSENRTFSKLSGGLDLNARLIDLPIQNKISAGTFSIAGRTFSITSASTTLQDIMNDINTSFNNTAGINPESDLSHITLEYDTSTDKFYLDTGDFNSHGNQNIPVLGSPTDTSNFLQAIRLLDLQTESRDADVEINSGVSIFNAGDGAKAWLAESDPLLSNNDSRMYSSFNGVLYKRVNNDPQYSPTSQYNTGNKVYSEGYVYEAIGNLPTSTWSGTESSLGDQLSYNNAFYELMVDLNTFKVDDFSSVDSGNHSFNSAINPLGTGTTDAYKAGDIVKSTDGMFFRSIKDRTSTTAIDWNAYNSTSGHSSAIENEGWVNNVPSEIFKNGRVYQISSGVNASVHGGPTDNTIYSSTNGWGAANNLVTGNATTQGAPANQNYFIPNTTNWDAITVHNNTSAYNAGDIVTDGTDFWQASTAIGAGGALPVGWTNVTNSINDLDSVGTGGLADNFWNKADLSVTNNNYWDEIAHANSVSDFDASYWQQIKPEMTRFDESGNGAIISSLDYSIWAKVGNVAGFHGADSTAGTHDSGETGLPNDGNFAYQTWNVGSTTQAGDYVEHSGKIFQARITTLTEPGVIGSENDWNIIADSATSTMSVSEQANRSRFTDTTFWQQVTIPDPGSDINYWEKIQETVITSSYPLGAIDMTVSLASSNFANNFTGLTSGLGNFFIGDGEGAVRIDYDVNNDSLYDLIERINSSDANIEMFYDPVGDRFVVKNKENGSIGITMHESPNWDTLAGANVNIGTGNVLELMGLVAPQAITDVYNSSTNYQVGSFTSKTEAGVTTYWQSLQKNPTDSPSNSSSQWRQVIRGVGRTLNSELGDNSSIQVNDGSLIYSTGLDFNADNHGYNGISFNIGTVSIGGTVGFSVDKDIDQAKTAINKFVEEFNDAQNYISSLTKVDNTGDEVRAATFTGNTEISRLGGELRKLVFGDTTPHSESGRTTDGANLIINSNDASNTSINAIQSQLSLTTSDAGYMIKVLNQAPSGDITYFNWDGTNWQQTDAAFRNLRITDVGLDFGIGSDLLKVTDSSLLTQALEDEPERVMALFGEEKVVGAYDLYTKTNRDYQGISSSLDEYITNFLSGDSNLGYKGAYQTHIDSLKAQNERIDDKVESLNKYLESREKQLSDGFIKMEEMQSSLDGQMQALQNSFPKKK